MTREECKSRLLQCIGNRSAEIISIGETIYKNPETGYKEYSTSRFVAEKLRGLGFAVKEFDDIPGVKATLDTGRAGPGIALIGELDAIICAGHPDSNKETGAVHACGHNAQIATMLGAAAGLMDSSAARELSGRIHFIAVPAEEYIEVAFRSELRRKGVIKYLGGKPELMHRGWFDDVDICLMLHTESGDGKFLRQSTCNGCLVKKIRYKGKAAHAGGNPEDGINALYAANVGLTALNSIRETFKDADCIRVHPIITKGGEIVNVIPDDVRLETFVRGRTMQTILDANIKVNRAFAAGAAALGAKVEIEDLPGYFPLMPDVKLDELTYGILCELAGEDVGSLEHSTGSTDMGDLSQLMPSAQHYMGGAEGGLHSVDFRFTDPDTAYVIGAKFLALAAMDLLFGDAAAAREVIKCFKPAFRTKQEYFEYMDRLFSVNEYPSSDIIG